MKLLSLVGTSPGVLHTVLCLLAREGRRPARVVIVATIPEAAEEATAIAAGCPCPWTRRPPIDRGRIEVVVLPYSDVDSPEKVRDFRRRIAALLDLDTVLDVTGGRKAMAIAAAIEATRQGVPVLAAQLTRWSDYHYLSRSTDPCKKTAPQNAKLIHFF